MSKNLWDEDEGDFNDSPVEMRNGKWEEVAQPPVQVQQPRATTAAPKATPRPPVVEEQVSYDHVVGDPDLDLFPDGDPDEEDYDAILSDANLRLEQGNLYKMIMNHELFAGLEADPKAVKNVQREIKRFAKERMEVMLGMRQEKVAQGAIVSSPFNELEVDILKKLASKATNGATETPEANQYAQAIKDIPRRQGLNSIGGSTKPAKSAPAPITQAPKQAQKLPSRPAAPVQRKTPSNIEAILQEEGIPRELIEEDYVPLSKPADQLSAEELLTRNKQAAARRAKHQTVKSPNALPMATYEQEEIMALQRAAQVAQGPGMPAILAKLNQMGPSKT